MARKPRKRFDDLELSDRDKKLIEDTASKGGVGSTAASIEQKPPSESPVTPATVKPVEKAAVKADAESLFSTKDLRCYIPKDSKLAAALAEQVLGLDKVAQRLVVPATVLKEFIIENDAELATLFKKNNSLK